MNSHKSMVYGCGNALAVGGISFNIHNVIKICGYGM